MQKSSVCCKGIAIVASYGINVCFICTLITTYYVAPYIWFCSKYSQHVVISVIYSATALYQ